MLRIEANTGKRGSCHLFRHTMATLMLENGADIRFIQAIITGPDNYGASIQNRCWCPLLGCTHWPVNDHY